MKLSLIKRIPNMIIHCMDDAEIIASSGYTLYTSKNGGETFNKITTIKDNYSNYLLSMYRFPSRLMRLGIRDVRKLEKNTFLINTNSKLYYLSNNMLKIVYEFKNSFGPLREAWCLDKEKNHYLAEYPLNNDRKLESILYKSCDGLKWNKIYHINNIRHIHCIMYDNFTNNLWMGTGDKDKESRIMVSNDGGNNWRSIGAGSQKYRTLGFLFTEKFVYWGSDSSTETNFIYRYDRQSTNVEKKISVNGPVYYSTFTKDGILFFATTAEIKNQFCDDTARIYASVDGNIWSEILNFKKDNYPYIMQFGTILFPFKKTNYYDLIFSTIGLNASDNTSYIYKII